MEVDSTMADIFERGVGSAPFLTSSAVDGTAEPWTVTPGVRTLMSWQSGAPWQQDRHPTDFHEILKNS